MSSATDTSTAIDGTKTELNETRRTYHFHGGDTVVIDDVVELIVRPSGTHRIRTALGALFVINPGWLAIEIIDEKADWTA